MLYFDTWKMTNVALYWTMQWYYSDKSVRTNMFSNFKKVVL